MESPAAVVLRHPGVASRPPGRFPAIAIRHGGYECDLADSDVDEIGEIGD